MGEFIPRPDIESVVEAHGKAGLEARLTEVAARLAGHPEDEVLAELQAAFTGFDLDTLRGWAKAISEDV